MLPLSVSIGELGIALSILNEAVQIVVTRKEQPAAIVSATA
jgi:hypothetical protein